MSETQATFFGIILFSLVVYLNFKMLKKLFHFFKSHLKETIAFTEKQNSELIEIKKPKKEDWENNPFKNRSSKLIEIALPFPLISHQIIIVKNSKGAYVKYWLQTTSSFFAKNNIKFKQDLLKTVDVEIKKEIEKNIKIVDNKCPGCLNKVELTDVECKNCGLAFE